MHVTTQVKNTVVELTEAEHTEMIRAKVAASRANPGAGMTTSELREHLQDRFKVRR